MSLIRYLLGRFRQSPRGEARPPRKAHPLNVPGPLYVEEGCCLACGVWETVGASLLAWDESDYPQCYVARQPETEEDFRNVAEIVSMQEVDCIRVRNCPARLREILEAARQTEYIDD